MTSATLIAIALLAQAPSTGPAPTPTPTPNEAALQEKVATLEDRVRFLEDQLATSATYLGEISEATQATTNAVSLANERALVGTAQQAARLDTFADAQASLLQAEQFLLVGDGANADRWLADAQQRVLSAQANGTAASGVVANEALNWLNDTRALTSENDLYYARTTAEATREWLNEAISAESGAPATPLP
jgi:hypothetical protein